MAVWVCFFLIIHVGCHYLEKQSWLPFKHIPSKILFRILVFRLFFVFSFFLFSISISFCICFCFISKWFAYLLCCISILKTSFFVLLLLVLSVGWFAAIVGRVVVYCRKYLTLLLFCLLQYLTVCMCICVCGSGNCLSFSVFRTSSIRQVNCVEKHKNP